jgi:hypothetical protein
VPASAAGPLFSVTDSHPDTLRYGANIAGQYRRIADQLAALPTERASRSAPPRTETRAARCAASAAEQPLTRSAPEPRRRAMRPDVFGQRRRRTRSDARRVRHGIALAVPAQSSSIQSSNPASATRFWSTLPVFSRS